MLDTLMPQPEFPKLKIQKQKGEKLGKCVLCGERVRTGQKYITTTEGYTHKNCLRDWKSN